MKNIKFFVLVIFFISNQFAYSQEIPEGAIMINENTLIKDESGKKVEMSVFMEMMNSGKWTMDPVKDSDGKLQYIQLKKLSEKEQKLKKQTPLNENASEIIGKRAPEFSFEDLNGNLISSENTKGKIVVLNFWFTTCKPCINEIPELNEVFEKYKNEPNVVFASITFDKRNKVNSFLKVNPIAFPVVADSRDVCDIFKIKGYPTNIIIDQNGNYFDYIMGGFDQIGNKLSNSILRAKEGKKPQHSNVPQGAIKLDANSKFKLENGDIVPFNKVIELLNSNNYNVETKKENGEEYYLLSKIKK